MRANSLCKKETDSRDNMIAGCSLINIPPYQMQARPMGQPPGH